MKQNNTAASGSKRPSEPKWLRKSSDEGCWFNTLLMVEDRPIIMDDLRRKCQPDYDAEDLLRETFPEWMDERLRQLIIDAMRGLSNSMALEVTGYVQECWIDGIRHFTNIRYIDKMLHSLYNKILYAATQKQVKLGNCK